MRACKLERGWKIEGGRQKTKIEGRRSKELERERERVNRMRRAISQIRRWKVRVQCLTKREREWVREGE